jgi:hypothetical protein
MMLPDKKKVSAIIIAKMRKDKPDEMSEAPRGEYGGVEDDSVAKETAAEELLKAIESKSPAAIAEAFSSMMELCGHNDEESEQESE